MVVVAVFAASTAKAGASSCDHVHPTANQFGRQRRQTLVFVPGPSVFDGHVLALDVADLL